MARRWGGGRPRSILDRGFARQRPRPLRRHAIEMGDRQRIIRQRHVDPRQRAPRPADQIEWPPAPIEIAFAKCRADHLLRLLAALGIGLDPKHSERQRQAMPGVAAVDLDQFQAAAAKIADQPRRAGDPVQYPLAGVARLVGLADHPAGQSDRAHFAHEVGAVGGLAHRRGRNHPDGSHMHVVEQSAEALQRPDRARSSLGRKRLAPTDSLAQAGQHFLIVQSVARPRRPGIDHQPHRVRSDVDDRNAVARGRTLALQRPRSKRSLGTFRPLFKAWPRPDKLGLAMK